MKEKKIISCGYWGRGAASATLVQLHHVLQLKVLWWWMLSVAAAIKVLFLFLLALSFKIL